MVKIISSKLLIFSTQSMTLKTKYDVTIELKQCIHERSLENIITVSKNKKKNSS